MLTMPSFVWRRSLCRHGRLATTAIQQNCRILGTLSSRRSLAASTASSTPSDSPPSSPVTKHIHPHDEHHHEQQRRRLSDVPISEILKAKHSFRWVDPKIANTATLKEAVVTVIEGGLSGMMVVDHALLPHKHRVVGLLTSRDLLRIMALGIKDGDSSDQIFSRVVGDYMTPISQVIYGRPEETVGMCRTIMAKLGIKCLPILSKQGRVEGLITAKDMADFGLSAQDKGGKKSFLTDVSERVGLSSDTSMAEPPSYLQAHLALSQTPLFVNVGVAELPHPFKTHDGVGMNRRDFGPHDLSTDPSLSEDAWFVTSVELPDEKPESGSPEPPPPNHKLRSITYAGVADGVGSWREYGVDPRDFSRRLMQECQHILWEAAAPQHPDGRSKFRRVIAPAEILAQAYERVKADNVIGSSTACVALFDSVRHQLHFSNLGDSGIVLLRHIDSDVAGSLKRDRTKPRSERSSDLQVSYVSQQQLRSFNHPFQLGWTGEDLKPGEQSSFYSAKDACSTSLHVRRGDIIILATDGLFDNVDIDEILSIALDWEQRNGFIRGGDIAARERRWQMGNSLTVLSAERIQDLAQVLAKKARENSLDSTLDSPFAILAKENDIMWSGGMPDDCTIVAMHVVGRAAEDTMDKDNQ